MSRDNDSVKSEHPSRGMYFETARKKAVRIAKNDKIKNKELQSRLVNSLTNQIRLHDGERAVAEVQKEILRDTNNHSSSTLGWSPVYGEKYKDIFKK